MVKPTSPEICDALRDERRRENIRTALEIENGDFAATHGFEEAVTTLRHFEKIKYLSELTPVAMFFLDHWDQLSIEAQQAFVQ